MGYTFEHAFAVKAPADRVWSYLTDPYRVASALPGAAITEKADDGSYAGTITMKVGPVSAKYKGKLRFEELDEVGRTARIAAKGQDTSGRGGADMKMTSRLAEVSPGETEVTMTSEVNVTGILAQFGRGMIQDVSNQMFQRFTEAVRATLEVPDAIPAEAAVADAPAVAPQAAPPAPAPPIEVVSFGAAVAGRAAGRLARQPLAWAVVVVAVLLIVWLLTR